MPVLIGDGHAPGRPRVTRRGISEVTGQVGVARSGTREEIRSFRERARAAHDYSADISDKVQRGRKRCCMAWSEAQSTSGSAE